MTLSTRRMLRSGVEAVRTGWVIIGITLAILILMESVVRVRRHVAARGANATPTYLAGDPRAESWYADYQREFEATRDLRWRPYVYYRRAPATGRYINIDSLGHRRTPQPAQPGTPAARVFLYGGSTMWGEPQREDRTIAAELARRLQPLAGPGARVEVRNVAETGYVFTQEVLQLMLDLRAGSRPDVVVFYDGINDVAAAVQRGAPGEPQNEHNRIGEFRLGRALTRTGYGGDLGKDLSALSVIGGLAFQRLALVQWAQSKKPTVARTFISADSAARGIAHTYAESAALVELLAARYGFTPVYVWQPNVHATEKRLNPHEQDVRRQIERDRFHGRLREVHQAVPTLLDSAMRGVTTDRFVNAASLFKDDSQAVFVDIIGHTTESSIPTIVDAFWPTLEAVVSRELGCASAPSAAKRAPAVAPRPAPCP